MSAGFRRTRLLGSGSRANRYALRGVPWTSFGAFRWRKISASYSAIKTDVGHSHGTFLTREFIYGFARRHATQLRVLAVEAAFATPLVVLGAALSSPPSPSLAARVSPSS